MYRTDFVKMSFHDYIADISPGLLDFFIRCGGYIGGYPSGKIEYPGLYCLYTHHLREKHIDRFSGLMASLKDNFDFINTERINLSAEEISGHKKKSFLHLSFDDGFKNNLLAAAVLKKYGIPAVFFITTDIINRDFKRLPPVFRRYIKDEELMDWDDVRRLGDMGFEIGSHSLSHNPSSELSSGDSSREFSESKRIIEEETGLPVKSFSFPFGRRRHFSHSDLENIYLAGYKYVFSTELNNCQHDFKGDNINCFGRIGFEPYLSPESINILLNGFLRYFR